MLEQSKEEKGCVYFFRHVGLSPVKIGYSNNESPIKRFSQFKTYAPYGSEILGFIQTDEAKLIETKLHLKYSKSRLFGEWFEITEEEVKREVDLYSNIEDIKSRNEFQIAWANSLINKRKKIEIEIDSLDDKKNDFLKRYNENNNINKAECARKYNVSKRTIFYWIKNQ